MKIFSKDEFYKKIIGENYKYGISEKEKKDKYTPIIFTIYFKENGESYIFNCDIKREPLWQCDCQMIQRFIDIKEKYVAPDLHIDIRKEGLNSSYKLYRFLERFYKTY